MPPTGKSAFWAVLGAIAIWTVAPARAYVTELPVSLAHDVLSETTPTAFAAFDLSTEDYVLEWLEPAPEGVRVSLLADTIQWVRVADVLTLPRARLRVDAEGGQAWRVSNADFSQALALSADSGPTVRWSAEIPVTLMSGERNSIDLSFIRGDLKGSARAVLRFKPRQELGAKRVFYDPSCSRFGLHAVGTAQNVHAKGWAYVGCRLAIVNGAEHSTSSLEAWVYWDGVGQNLLVGGVMTPSSSASVWGLRLRTDPGSIQLAVPGGGDEMVLKYSTPENFHRAFIGAGLGPYWDRFTVNGESLSNPGLVLTVYGSYFLTESLRVVGFDATTLDPNLTTDFGIYINTEYLKFLDRRIVINLLLGGHAIGFRNQGHYYVKFGIPQGMEASYIDFLKKGHNLTTGIFLYPLINGISYTNVWLRWGSAQIFGEFNYISWDEVVGDQAFHSDSAGISIGVPLARFF